MGFLTMIMEVDELKIEYYQINGLGYKPEQCRAPAGDPPSRMDDLQSCIFLMQNLKRRRHALARERVDQGLHIPGSVRPISFEPALYTCLATNAQV
jgi:hypothetical protein